MNSFDPNQLGAIPSITTTSGTTAFPGYVNYGGLGQAITTPDHRDREIESLRHCLHEAYAEIGRLHETIRGMQAFDQFSEKMAKAQKP
jgi:hypothetical protein